VDVGKLFRDAWGLLVKDIGQLIVGLLLAAVIPGVVVSGILFVAFLIAMPWLTSVSGPGEKTGAFSAASVAVIVAAYVAGLVLEVLVSVPLYAGVLIGALRRVREGRVMGYGDLFSGFHVYGRVVWTCVLAYVLVPLGVLAVPAVVIALGAGLGSALLIVAGVALALVAALLLVYLLVCWLYALVIAVDRDVGATEALRESRALVHRTGWWWTFVAVLLLQAVVVGVGLASGFLPFAGAAVGVFTAPFAMTWLLAMYFQARREDWMIGAAVAAGRAPPARFPPAPPAPPAPPEQTAAGA
jgi:hypothetical protein